MFFYQKNDPYIWFYCNFKPFCFLINCVLLKREHMWTVVLLSIPLNKLPCPKLRPPLKLLATAKDNFYGQMSLDNLPSKKCTFGSCFDLSRCPLSSGFPVYFYNNLYGWTSTKVKILIREVGLTFHWYCIPSNSFLGTLFDWDHRLRKLLRYFSLFFIHYY